MATVVNNNTAGVAGYTYPGQLPLGGPVPNPYEAAAVNSVAQLHHGDIVIRAVENGFVVIFGITPYSIRRTFVASSYDEIAEILKTEAVKEKLNRAAKG